MLDSYEAGMLYLIYNQLGGDIVKNLQIDNNNYEVDFVTSRPYTTSVMIYLKNDNWVEVSKRDFKDRKVLKLSSEQILSKSNKY